jgi:ceramide glucosyltransferase
MMLSDTWARVHPAFWWMGVGLLSVALLYSLIVLIAVLARRRAQPHGPVALKAVSVLKPLCGLEPQLYECLKSFCQQEYPAEVQLVFGVAQSSDPAIAVVRRLQREFPKRDLVLVVDATQHGQNPKVSNLKNMMRGASHEWLIVADSDIRVSTDYLARVAAHLADDDVGIVTCAYTGRAVGGFWSQVSAEFICGWFTPQVYVSSLLGSRAFAFGATIALRRKVLEAIGGFAAIADQMADDYRLGEATRRLGWRTVLSEVVVETTVNETTLAQLTAHQMRWLRTIRGVRPAGYLMAGITFSIPLALLGSWLTDFDWRVLVALPTVALVRILASRLVRLDQAKWGIRQSLLGPLSDVIVFGLWCFSFVGHRVTWRATSFDIDRLGAAHRVRGALAEDLAPPSSALTSSERV